MIKVVVIWMNKILKKIWDACWKYSLQYVWMVMFFPLGMLAVILTNPNRNRKVKK
jgi:hypothetical protein